MDGCLGGFKGDENRGASASTSNAGAADVDLNSGADDASDVDAVTSSVVGLNMDGWKWVGAFGGGGVMRPSTVDILSPA